MPGTDHTREYVPLLALGPRVHAGADLGLRGWLSDIGQTGLTPIVCVGELLADREAGKTEAVLTGQCQKGIAGLTEQQFARIIIAYKPCWAIGTGKTATPEMAADAHRVIRAQVRAKFGNAAPARSASSMAAA